MEASESSTPRLDVAGPPPGVLGELPRGNALGRYLILEPVGSGGMGLVYSAYDPQLERKVAIKLLRHDWSDVAAERLLREAKALARLAHPNVVAVHDVGHHRSQLFLAMEHVDGVTLSRWLDGEERSWQEIIAIFRQAGLGLAAAHRAGLIHRDFKPQNVMVGGDGRARVLDFGLARNFGGGGATVEEVELPEAIASPSDWGPAITQPGAIVGTPRYMAPELLERQGADEKSDQFSFCVSLYEALYRQPPFEGALFKDLMRAVVKGQLRPPPAEATVPGWLWPIVSRGLARNPADRFPDMEALLAALDDDPSLRRRRRLRIAAGVSATAVAVVAAWLAARAGRGVCRGAEAHLAGVWDAPTRARVERTFLAQPVSFAPQVWETVAAALDDQAGKWVAMRTEACEATRISGEQSEELLDLRMGCLDQRLAELRSLTSRLAAADAEMLERAVSAVGGLPGLAACADASWLRSVVRPPEDPGTRARVDAAHQEIATIRALRLLGRYEEALAVSGKLRQEVDDLGFAPLAAALGVEVGQLHDLTGADREAEEDFFAAMWAAEAAGDDRTAATGAGLLGFVIGVDADRPAEGLRWTEHATALVSRHGGDPEAALILASSRSAIFNREGRNEEALAEGEKAEVIAKGMPPSLVRDLRLASARNNKAIALRKLGRESEAILVLEANRELQERMLGAEHPTLLMTLSNLAGNYVSLGELEKAKPLLERSVAIGTAKLGPEHPSVSRARANLAQVLLGLGQYDAAGEIFASVVEVRERTLGPSHSSLAAGLIGLGQTRLAQLRPREALPLFERAYAIDRVALGADHPDLAYDLTGVGTCHLELGRPDLARPFLERALALRENGPDPVETGLSRWQLGRALWADPAERTRARALIEQSIGELSSDSRGEEEAADARAFLAREGR